MSQNVVVTGAGDSVCRVIAEAFVARGDRVHICDVRPDAVSETLERNPAMRGTVADVGSDEDVDQLFEEAVEWLGRVDALINGVGIAGPRAPIEEISSTDWAEIMNVNVTGFARCIRRALPGMKQQGRGSIVNFSSCSSHLAPPLRAAYVASKAAVEGLTRCVAREVGPAGVRCNAILPGAIDNERLRRIFERNAAAQGMSVDEYQQEVLSYVSLRRAIEMEEFANLVLFLCSDHARGITGQLLRLDGNMEWESP